MSGKFEISRGAPRSGTLRDVNSMLASALCHLAAMIALGLYTAASGDGWHGVKLLVIIGDGVESPTLDETPLDAVELEASVDNSAAAVDPVRLFDVPTTATADIAKLDALTESAAEPSGLAGLALTGTGAGDGVAAGGSAEFFGIGGYGQSFVYVVDCSDSMNERGKFERAVYELLHSIEQLASDQRYYVIFYNDAAYPMESDEPVPATEEEFARTRRWVSDVRPNGGTHPLPALLFALSLEPDAIYFLSDGQFDPATIYELHSRSRRLSRPIPIHTVALMDRFAERLMRAIARNSGGEHRFVK